MDQSPDQIDFKRRQAKNFWWVSPQDIDNLSLEALVEATLNYGRETDVKELFNLYGTNTVADIFRKQSQQPRQNYLPLIKNYFTLYFNHHAPQYPH